MMSKYLLIILACSISVNADLLEDYVMKRLENLPNWLANNTADELVVPGVGISYADTFLRLNLKPSNFLAKGFPTLQMASQPAVSATTRTPSLSLTLSVSMTLELVGNYDVDGVLFPDFEALPFNNSGFWSMNVRMTKKESFVAKITVGMNGTMHFTFAKTSNGGTGSSYYPIEIFNFLPEHTNQWYYQSSLIKLGNQIKSSQYAGLSNLDLFQKYFEETFQNMNYFDFLGAQNIDDGTLLSMSS